MQIVGDYLSNLQILLVRLYKLWFMKYNCQNGSVTSSFLWQPRLLWIVTTGYWSRNTIFVGLLTFVHCRHTVPLQWLGSVSGSGKRKDKLTALKSVTDPSSLFLLHFGIQDKMSLMSIWQFFQKLSISLLIFNNKLSALGSMQTHMDTEH